MKQLSSPLGLSLAVVFLLITVHFTKAQTPTANQALLDSIISITEMHSVYADQVDWDSLRSEMFSRLSASDSVEAIIAPVEYMFAALGDFHGGLLLKGRRYNSYYKTEYPYPVDLSIINAINQMGSEIDAGMLADGIAYLKIPHLYLSNPAVEVPEWTAR
ncbi:MAG: hypothetical protein KDC44_10060, partial [Phaeodactylibacter sp.]|nr:hypothetical protein [Phaeodactylibacter sp.]